MLYRHQDKDFLAYPPSYRLRASDKPFAPSGHRLRTKLRTRWKIFILKTILQGSSRIRESARGSMLSKDLEPEIVKVTKAKGAGDDKANGAIHAFNKAIGDAFIKIGEDLAEPVA